MVMLDSRYLSKSWICGCQQKRGIIGLTFKRAAWLEAQVRHHQHTYGHRNLGVRLKRAVRKAGRNPVECGVMKPRERFKIKQRVNSVKYRSGQIK